LIITIDPDKSDCGLLPIMISGDNIRILNSKGQEISREITDVQDLVLEITFDP